MPREKINFLVSRLIATFTFMAAIYDKYTEVNNGQNTRIGSLRPEVLKERFLDLYVTVGSVAKTCDMLGMVRRTFYHWKAGDKEFAEKFKQAEEMALGLLEDEAKRRAMYGTDRPVYQNGKLVGHVKEYSDTLLIVLLKAHAPHKYKERFSGELTGADGKPLVPEMKIVHVHSPVPIANLEENISKEQLTLDVEHEVIPAQQADQIIITTPDNNVAPSQQDVDDLLA